MKGKQCRVKCGDVYTTSWNSRWQDHRCDIATHHIPCITMSMRHRGGMQHEVHSNPSCALVHGSHPLLWWGNDSPAKTMLAATTIFSHQFLGQLQVEALHVWEGTRGTVVLHEDENNGDCHIQQKGEDIFVKFPAVCPAGIISSELVLIIHSHVFVVADDGLRTGDWYPSSILQLRTLPTPAGWQLDDITMTILRSHPGTRGQFSFLDSYRVSPKKVIFDYTHVPSTCTCMYIHSHFYSN